ncbi:MAG: 23S rRNA (uracil(1939)-C(5))-methyltransferase RlmD [bacterium]|nr:23S rRNA (uracil(1939)-C(5))-methyltransferase RlmD [bacterium]
MRQTAAESHSQREKSKKKKAMPKRAGQKETGQQGPARPEKRETAVCAAAGRCGGCTWIGKDYREQLEAKEKRFRRMMEPYCKPEPIIGMEEAAHYRNKVHAAFGEDRRHNVISGIYEENSHRIVPLDSCYIENQKADEIIVSIRGLLKSFKIRPYNEDTGYGLLRHVLIRTGHATGQVLVVLVLSSPIMPSKNNFVRALLKLHPEITAIVVNVNDRDTGMVLGEKEQVIYGKGYIEDKICGKTFRISAKSFYQVNPVQAEKLYRKALEYAELTGGETVVDAYCGTGTIGIVAAEQAGRVIGVENNRDAVKDARSNAKRNQVYNIEFYENDAGKVLTEMAQQGAQIDLVILDPPRSGSSEAFLEAAARLAPRRVIYISCNPDTLVRDLKLLTGKGYKVQRGVAVDMFPFTEHTEAIVCLDRKQGGDRPSGSSPKRGEGRKRTKRD